MLRSIFIYGTIAGLIAGGALSAVTLGAHAQSEIVGLLIGYTTMLIALSAVFVAIKRRRDKELGGVIKFWPALGLGLGISAVAGIFYAAAWDLALWITHMDFAGNYAKAMIAAEKAKGVSGAELRKVADQWNAWAASYANPLYRWTETFTEIFPVGVLVSLVSAGLLRNSRFLPARKQ